MNESTAIQTKNLSKAFGSISVLHQINIEVEKGIVFGILGPNGAGKTTFIRLLTGASKASSGELRVLGLDPIRSRYELRKRIGYMPQNPALYEDLSPIDNLRFFGRAKNSSELKRRIDEVLHFVGLEERAKDDIYKFSGGMKQRVSLACALVNKPEFLLLDEPTSGIDPKLRESFWKHFKSLSKEGVTILVSTHQMDEAMHCDKLAVLHRGKVLANKDPHSYLWENKASIKLHKEGQAKAFNVSNYPAALPALLQQEGLDPKITRIEIEEDNLEKVILRLIDEDTDQHHREAAHV